MSEVGEMEVETGVGGAIQGLHATSAGLGGAIRERPELHLQFRSFQFESIDSSVIASQTLISAQKMPLTPPAPQPQ
jgi:hypothetical protein